MVLIAVIMGRSGHILLEAELATCHDFGGHPGSRSVALNITLLVSSLDTRDADIALLVL